MGVLCAETGVSFSSQATPQLLKGWQLFPPRPFSVLNVGIKFFSFTLPQSETLEATGFAVTSLAV